MGQIESRNRDLRWYIPYMIKDAEERHSIFKTARLGPVLRFKQVFHHVGGLVINEYRIHVLGSAATLLRLVVEGHNYLLRKPECGAQRQSMI